jgi:acyl-CoA synthetase (AMP-forming)/AMP-acid ligase II/NAD(P)-dependent dehydrogenase (short-subunit alcohol dehydrogenase family)
MSNIDMAGGDAAQPLGIPGVRLPELVLGRARGRGAKPALIEADSGREISYEGLVDAVGGAAAWLVGVGVRPGDVVALCAPSSIEYVIAWYAASSAGAVLTTVNPVLTAEELRRHLRRTDTRWLVTTDSLFTGKLAAVAGELPGLAETLVFGPDVTVAADAPVEGVNSAAAARRFDAVGFAVRPAADGHAANGRVPGIGPGQSPAGPGTDDVALLASSSGTTGRPKIVVLTHRNLIAGLDSLTRAEFVAERDVSIALTPMFHVYGLQGVLNAGLIQGATIVILPRFEFGAFLRAIQDYRATRADIVPPVAVLLAKSELVAEFDLSSLRLLMSAAAPLSIDVARACGERLGVRVIQAFGLTEAGGGTHFGLAGGPDHPDSVGPALPGVESRVVDPDTGKDRATGEPGELVVRAPSVMRGYLDDPAATAAAVDADGWLRTGDVVTADADGWYRVTDRIKELIKYKGFQVAPAELEDALLAHPAVADAAVVRSPDESAGEVPKAFVVRQPGVDPIGAQELMDWVAERVAPYKKVRRVEFTDSIPKSAAGKILRRQLVERESHAAADRLDLTGTVVLVSGGSRGLGRLLAAELARAGAAVGLLARSADQLSAAVAEIERDGGIVAAVTADVTDRESLTAAVAGLTARLGQPDVLVNNAGVSGPVGQLWDADPEEWNRAFAVNVTGAFALSQIVLPQMVTRGHGRIINITSNAAVYRWPLLSAYAASKAALVKLSETLAVETGRYGVAVLSFDPGLLPIGLGESAVVDRPPAPGAAEDQVMTWIRKRMAGGHGADPAQATRLLGRLAAGDADRLSGRHLTVTDDLDAVLANIDQVRRDDLHYLRLRTSAR